MHNGGYVGPQPLHGLTENLNLFQRLGFYRDNQ